MKTNAINQTASQSLDAGLTEQELASVSGGDLDLVKTLKLVVTVVSRALRHPITFND